MPEQEELNLKETLAFLKIGRSSLYRLMEAGRIQPSNRTPLLSRPGKLKFRKSDLERLMDEAKEDQDARRLQPAS
jgi:predicted site-specific integrase-resolvase